MTQKEKQQYAVGTCALIAVGIVSLSAYVESHKPIVPNQVYYDKVASDFVKTHKSANESIYIPSSIETDASEDYTWFTGESLNKALGNNKIKFCKILDEYYTPNGDSIALVKIKEVINAPYEIITDPETLESVKEYHVPMGYTLVGDKGERIRITACVLEGGKTPESIVKMDETDEIVDVQIIDAKPYSSIISSDIVVDVPEESVENISEEAEVKLVKKAQ